MLEFGSPTALELMGQMALGGGPCHPVEHRVRDGVEKEGQGEGLG